jgi:hypothetical protein
MHVFTISNIHDAYAKPFAKGRDGLKENVEISEKIRYTCPLQVFYDLCSQNLTSANLI